MVAKFVENYVQQQPPQPGEIQEHKTTLKWPTKQYHSSIAIQTCQLDYPALFLASHQSIPPRTEAQITQLVEKITSLITESTSFYTRDGELLIVFWKDRIDVPFSFHGLTGPTGVLAAAIQDFEEVYPPPPLQQMTRDTGI